MNNVIDNIYEVNYTLRLHACTSQKAPQSSIDLISNKGEFSLKVENNRNRTLKDVYESY